MALFDEIEVRVYRSYVKIPLIFFIPVLTLLSAFSLAYFYANSPYAWRLVEDQFHSGSNGHLELGYLEVGPTLTNVKAHQVLLSTPDREPVIAVDELGLELNALMLVVGRVEFSRGLADGARVHLIFDQESGNLNLFEALGFYDEEEEEDDDESSGTPITIADLAIVNSEFELNHWRFGFAIDEVNFPSVSLFREPAATMITVPEVLIPHGRFWFYHHLFGAPADQGDWEFEVTDFQVENWRWLGGGFTVEEVLAQVEGIGLEARGTMRFPTEDGERNMIYDATGAISSQFQSTALEYFTGGNIRFEIPRTEVDLVGDFHTIDGRFDAEVTVARLNGLFLEDVKGVIHLRNRFVLADELTARFYDADLEAYNGFFNIFDRRFGADIYAQGLNPRAMMIDLVGEDYEFLGGALDGGVSLVGEIPRQAIPRVEHHNYALMDDAMAKMLQMEIIEEATVRRDNDLLLPNELLNMEVGSQFWVDQRRLGMGHATFTSGQDRVMVKDFYLGMPSMEFVRAHGSGLAEIRGNIAEMAPYTTYYNVDGLEGPAQFAMTMDGFFGSPEWELAGRMDGPGWRVSEDEVLPGDFIELQLKTRDGVIEVERAYGETDFGNFSATGEVAWYEPPPQPGTPPPWPIWLHRVEQPLSFDIRADGLELHAISHLIHPELNARGGLDVDLQLGGTMQALRGGFQATGEAISVREQHVEKATATGEFDPRGVTLTAAAVDLGEAGHYEGFGRYDYDGGFDFEMEGKAIDIAELVELQQMPTRLGGRGQFYMEGKGDLRDPRFSGGGQLQGVTVDGRNYGDIAVTAETLDGSVHLVGGLLPWLTASVEIPIDVGEPLSLRFGMEELALTRFLPEIQEHPMVDEAHVTGLAELFIERDFSRYQAVFGLSDLVINSRGQVLTNDGPLTVGFNNGEFITFDQARFESGGEYFTLQGVVALHPTLLDLRVDGNLDLALLDSARAGFPEFFPPYFVDATGYAETNVSIRGTPESYVALGTVLLEDSEWEIRFLQDPVVVDRGRVNLNERGIEIPEEEPLDGTVLDGATRVWGTLGYLPEHPREMDIRVWSHNMTYRIPELMTLAYDTDIHLQAPDWHDWETWVVGGRVDILDGVYQQDFNFVEQELAGRVIGAFGAGGGARYEATLFELFPILNDISFDMSVRARDNFFLRSAVDRMAMDLEFRFDLHLMDRLTNPRISGEVDVISGYVAFQGEAFEVSSGVVRFTEDVSNPYLDIQAGADIRNTCDQTDLMDEISPAMTLRSNIDTMDTRHYFIRLNIAGDLQNLDLQLESNPYADQRDILSLLLTGCTVDQLTAAGASGPTLEVALGPLLGRLEREIQDVVAVEEFTIMPGVERTQVHISDTLAGQWNWRFQVDTGLASTSGGLERMLSDRWRLTMEGRQRNERESDSSHIDLNLRLNYRVPLD